jgi:tRNA(Ile)-lysidine synthase
MDRKGPLDARTGRVSAVPRPVLEPWPAEVQSLLGRCTFPPPGSPITVAVSGGPDSLALLVLASAAGCVVEAVHVDHRLRPGSAAEADVVAEAARRFGAGFRAVRADVLVGANLEARARAARFAVLPEDVATGHTMDAQAETVLCNLLRGAGLDGLAAMRPGRRHPLLAVRRHETRAVCAALGLIPVSDPSNDDPRHLRNRVRHELLPLCADLARRDPVPVLARQADIVRDEAALLDELSLAALPDPTDARALSAAARPLSRRAVRRWLRGEGADRGTEVHPPSRAEVQRVLGVADGTALATQLSGGRGVRRSANRLSLALVGSGKVTPVQTDQAARATPAWASPAVGDVVVGAEDLSRRVGELGEAITADYAGRPPLLVGVLKGAMMFLSDLSRAIELPVEVDFMAVSSYGSATRTSGVVRIVKDLDADLAGRHVLVVEDIIDSGLTLNYLRHYLQARQPASLEVCALLVKEGEQRVKLDLRYVGFTIPSQFVVGYGLDVDERFRNLASVYRYRGEDPAPS